MYVPLSNNGNMHALAILPAPINPRVSFWDRIDILVMFKCNATPFIILKIVCLKTWKYKKNNYCSYHDEKCICMYTFPKYIPLSVWLFLWNYDKVVYAIEKIVFHTPAYEHSEITFCEILYIFGWKFVLMKSKEMHASFR